MNKFKVVSRPDKKPTEEPKAWEEGEYLYGPNSMEFSKLGKTISFEELRQEIVSDPGYSFLWRFYLNGQQIPISEMEDPDEAILPRWSVIKLDFEDGSGLKDYVVLDVHHELATAAGTMYEVNYYIEPYDKDKHPQVEGFVRY